MRSGLKPRVVVAGAVLVLVICGLFAVLFAAVRAQRRSANRAQESSRVLAAASRLETTTLDLETGLRGYVITRNARFLQPYNDGVRAYPQRAKALLALVADDPPQRARAATLRRQIDAYVRDYATGLIEAVHRNLPAASSEATTQVGKHRMDAIRAGFNGFGEIERALAGDRLRRASADSRAAVTWAVVALVALVALVTAFAVYVVRTIVDPLRRVAGAAERLAAGDLSARAQGPARGEVRSLRDAFNRMAAALEAERDRTEQQNTELRRLSTDSLARLDTVFAQAPVGIAFLDRKLRYERVNDALAAINGISAEDHIGHTIAELLPGLDPAVMRRMRSALLTGKAITDVEERGETPAAPGEERWWLASYYPVRGRDEEILGIGVVVVETTERRHAEYERELLASRERRALRRTARLQELTAALSRTATRDDVANVIAEHAGAALDAAAVAVYLPNDEERTLSPAAAHGSDEMLERWRRVHVDDELPLTEAFRSRTALFFEDLPELYGRFPALRGEIERAGHRAFALVPLSAGATAAGVAALAFRARRSFTTEDRVYIGSIAAQGAFALERAKLYDRERAIAQTLQHALLPPSLPLIDGVELAARFHAAGHGILVGGDFYDVIPIGEDRWLVVVGDVIGKGPAAATIGALARFSLRAEAASESTPSLLLAGVNEVLRREHGERLVTAVCALVDTSDPERVSLSMSVGGHPLPVVLRSDGRIERAGEIGTLLGAFEDPTLVDRGLSLEPGDSLVLFTDGLLEAHAPQAPLSDEELAQIISAMAGDDAEGIADRVAGTLRRNGGEPRDDVAILVLQVARG